MIRNAEHDELTTKFRNGSISQAEFIRKHDSLHARTALENGELDAGQYAFRLAQIDERANNCEQPPSV